MMILGLTDPPVRTISDWLQIATRGLTNASKERIRPEIEAHYAEAIEAHGEKGLPEAAAQKAALAELGDARAAGERFSRQYLTEEDIGSFKKWDKQMRSIWFPICGYFFFCFFTRDLLPFRHHWLESHHSVPLLFASAFIVWIAMPTACFAVARYTRAGSDGPVLFTLIVLSLLAVFAFIEAFVVHAAFDTFVMKQLIFLCWVFVGQRFRIYLRAWIKLSKARATNLGRA